MGKSSEVCASNGQHSSIVVFIPFDWDWQSNHLLGQHACIATLAITKHALVLGSH